MSFKIFHCILHSHRWNCPQTLQPKTKCFYKSVWYLEHCKQVLLTVVSGQYHKSSGNITPRLAHEFYKSVFTDLTYRISRGSYVIYMQLNLTCFECLFVFSSIKRIDDQEREICFSETGIHELTQSWFLSSLSACLFQFILCLERLLFEWHGMKTGCSVADLSHLSEADLWHFLVIFLLNLSACTLPEQLSIIMLKAKLLCGDVQDTQ